MNLGTGRGGKNFQDRELAAQVRSLALSQIKEILERDEWDELKKAVVLKLAGTVLPRLNEHTGEGGAPIVLRFDNAFIPSAEGDSEEQG